MSAARRRKKAERGRRSTYHRRLIKRMLRDGRLRAEPPTMSDTIYFLNVDEIGIDWDYVSCSSSTEKDLGCRP